MNDNQNPNLMGTNPAPNPAGAAPVTPTAAPVNPNMAAPSQSVPGTQNPGAPLSGMQPATPVDPSVPANGIAPANPNMTQVAPATPAPGQPVQVNPAAPNSTPVSPMTPPADANMAAPGIAPQTPGAPVDPMAAQNPTSPAPGAPLPGMQPNPTIQMMQPIAPAPNDPNAANGGQPPVEEAKTSNTRTIILVVVAVLAVVLGGGYIFLTSGSKPAPAANTVPPVTNTVENTTDNTVENTIAGDGNTTGGEVAKLEKYDMSWAGIYKKDDLEVSIYYVDDALVSVDFNKTIGSSTSSEVLQFDVSSTKTLSFEDQVFGDEVKIEIKKTTDGISISGKSDNKDSLFNITGDLTKEKAGDEWNGFYETEGGSIIITQLDETTGSIVFEASNTKYTNTTTTFSIKDKKLIISASSFSKDDTEIEKTSDGIKVKSDDFLSGEYTKLK